MAGSRMNRGGINAGISSRFRRWLEPPHPTWRSRASRNRIHEFLDEEEQRCAGGVRINVGSASQRFDVKTLNLDLFAGKEVDIQGDLLHLPLEDMSVDTVVCTGVLEHVCGPHQAVAEIHRVLRPGGGVFIETPFMQTVHVSPDDYQRWTPAGLRELMRNFEPKKGTTSDCRTASAIHPRYSFISTRPS